MINRKEYFGGEVISSGGYGCIFHPMIRCRNDSTTHSNTKITKLMLKKNAIEEFKLNENIKKHIQKIPNYKNYFLVDQLEMCQITELSKCDLKNFKKKCRALPKHGITQKNINTKLDKLSSIVIPYGGIRVDQFIHKNLNYEYFILYNNGMIELLQNAILPMNKVNVYHSDLKVANLLAQQYKNNDALYLHIIDWGLSHIENNNFQTIPKMWKSRPYQYNLPFTNILLSDRFLISYQNYLNKESNDAYKNDEKLKAFLLNFLYDELLGSNKNSHYNYINFFNYMMFIDTFHNNTLNKSITENTAIKFIENTITINIFLEQLMDVLKHFSKPKLTAKEIIENYTKTVLKKNMDVYGFVFCYELFIEIYYQNRNNITQHEKKIFEHIKQLFTEILYKNSHKPIDTNKLIQHLKKLNKMFFKIIPKTPKKTIDSIDIHKKRLTKKKLTSTQFRRKKMAKTMKRINSNNLFS